LGAFFIKINLKKQELRKRYLQKRMELSPDEYADFNEALLRQFETIDLTGIHCTSLFLPMLERREPNTFSFAEWLKETHPQINLAFPQSDFVGNTMVHYLEDSDLEIDTNPYGIPEPIKGNIVSNNDIDMVIIPLLAFDIKGYRVGYGKGFYDRFMANCKPDTQFIGLSFFEPVELIEDINEYDIPLHQCITPQKVWVF
jgi:5-formyltetrahydrofolate cyclo-ligase